MTAFFALLRRDLRLGFRQGIDALVVVLFFLAAGALFPFALGPEPALLARIAAGIVMTMAALASLLSLDRLFSADYEDGSLDGLALSPLSLELVALAKVATHWLMTGLPLLAAAPLLGLLLNLPDGLYPMLMLALVAVTPALSLLGGLGAALTLGARRGGLLLAFLILPLFIPILILGMGSVGAVAAGRSPRGAMELLLALDLGLLALVPWAMGMALRQVLK
ncbi:heme exporter protein CcmB [Dongia sp.]|uniref:heme exporter protein CcmB n=1 Tax=Dongia sp. TaxID=1977262 RepID=UPI0035B17FCC